MPSRSSFFHLSRPNATQQQAPRHPGRAFRTTASNPRIRFRRRTTYATSPLGPTRNRFDTAPSIAKRISAEGSVVNPPKNDRRAPGKAGGARF